MTLQQFEHGVGIYVTWLKAHEKIVLIAVAAFLAFHMYSKGLDAWVQHDQRNATAANTQAKSLETQLATLQAQNVQLSARIDQAMQQRAIQTVIQKKADDNLEPVALAARIQTQLGVGRVKYDTSTMPVVGELVFSNDASHKVARDEDDLQQAKADVVDLNTKLISCQGVNVVGDKALTAEKTAHADDVKLLKAEAHRSWLRGFKWGVITGFVGGLVIHKP